VTNYWIGVASRDHVRIGEAGGFCQLGHGRDAPVRRLSPGDGLVYYAPRERLRDGAPVQAFVAIARVRDGEAYHARQNETFSPWRRDVDYFACHEAPIRPLLDELSFITNRTSWGVLFRRASFLIPEADFLVIAAAMGVAPQFVDTPSAP
jgi:EVE domain